VPDDLQTYQGVAYPWHCDHMGHMNVMFYVGKFDEASWHLLTSIGLGPAALKAAGRGMVALEQHITYRREVLAGDVLTVRSTLLDLRPKVLTLRHEMRDAATGEVVALMDLTTAHIDTVLRRATPFPDTVRETIRSQLS